MLTNHLVRDLDDHDLSVLHTRNTQNGLVGVACVNPLHKKISRPGRGCAQTVNCRLGIGYDGVGNRRKRRTRQNRVENNRSDYQLFRRERR